MSFFVETQNLRLYENDNFFEIELLISRYSRLGNSKTKQ